MSRSASPSLPLYNAKPPSSLRVPSSGHSRQSSVGGSSSITSTYSYLSPEATATSLKTSTTRGLPPSEAEARLIRNGPNELPSEEPEPIWMRFLKQFKETLILLLLASATISFFMGNLDDAISITLAVTFVVSVGFVQEYRSEKSLEALNRLVPHSAHIIRGGNRSASTNDSPPATNAVEPGEGETRSASPSALERASAALPAVQLVVGDLVVFSTGDRIPADIRITRASGLSIDESNLTGENEAVEKYAEALGSSSRSGTDVSPPRSPQYASPGSGTVGADVRLNEKHNIAFMGTLVRSGHGQGIVIATGGETEFGRISSSLQEIESPRTPLQLSMDRLGQELSYISFGVIGFIVLIGLLQGRKLLDMFTIGVSLAVAAIPEGLPIIVTVTLALGVLRMAKRGAIVRRLPSVETLGSVNVICSDKTGTLTLNHMTVTKMWHFDIEKPFDVTKEAALASPGPATRTMIRIGNIANNGRLSRAHAHSPATAAAASILLSTADSSSASQKSRWVGQPTDVAVLDLLDAFGENDVRETLGARVAETPFSSERKWMGVVMGGDSTDAYNNSEVAFIKGALEQVLNRCDTYLTKDGREVILDEPRRKAAMQAAESMANEGLRVIAFASGNVSRNARPSFVSRSSSASLHPSRAASPRPGADSAQAKDDALYQGLVFSGMVGMNDPPRPDVHKSIRRLMAGGVKVIMITGDAEATAVAIAKKLGMPFSSMAGSRQVLTGSDLDQMSDDELEAAIATTTIFARTSPDHKMQIVKALQARGDVVAMTGDGVNDAPALKKADIGISMGLLGTDVAKEAADMILTDDDFSTILRAIEQGKGIFYNIQNFITFQLSTSVAALSLVLLSTLFGFKNPLNAMQILWINILMDGPPAQSLGVEPVDPAIMSRPPRSRQARVLTKPLIRRVLTSAMIIMAGTFAIYIREMSSVDPLETASASSASSIAARSASTTATTNYHPSRIVTPHDTTMTFTSFVLFDMFNALTCRSESKSILRGELHLFKNKMFNYAVLGSLFGQLCVIYLPFLQRVFQTEALAAGDLVKLVVVASTVFWADEGRKWWMYGRRRNFGVPGGRYSRFV